MNELNQLIEMEKSAYFDYVSGFTKSGVATLVRGGLDINQAVPLVKQACLSDPTSTVIATKLQLLEKIAAEIGQLEKQASEAPKKPKTEEDDYITKLASIGFTPEEIEQVGDLPTPLLTKIANVSQTPWEMGSGAGMAREKTDPLLEFILG